MTDFHRDNSKDRQNVNEEVFARFLKYLSPDTEEACRLYECLHKMLTLYCRMRGDSDPEIAANVTIDRAALKISAGAVVPDIDRYCRGIARNVVRERARKVQREISAFHEFIDDLDNSPAGEAEKIYILMKLCFEQLAVKDQQLLLAYCQEIQGRARAEHRRELAEAWTMTTLALRVRVTRLRNSLTNCVRERSNKI